MFAFLSGPNEWDASRVTAALPSGVGFLGAAVIWKAGTTVEDHQVFGLTTAASVWLSAAVGVASGGAQYFVAIFTVTLVMVMLRFGPRQEKSNESEDGSDTSSMKRDYSEGDLAMEPPIERFSNDDGKSPPPGKYGTFGNTTSSIEAHTAASSQGATEGAAEVEQSRPPTAAEKLYFPSFPPFFPSFLLFLPLLFRSSVVSSFIHLASIPYFFLAILSSLLSFLPFLSFFLAILPSFPP
jgi:hypothetical protein